MRRKTSVPRSVYWKCLLGLLLGGLLAGPAVAQEAPKPKGLIVPINGTRSIKLGSNENLKTVTNQDPTVARVAEVAGDPKQVLITGLKPGLTRVTLVDVKNAQEVIEVVVEVDLEILRKILRDLVPTAVLKISQAGGRKILIEGTVQRSEDIAIIMDTASGFVEEAIESTKVSSGLSSSTTTTNRNVINAMRVAGVQQVQLCVVVAQVSRTEFRRMGFNFLASFTHSFLASTVGQAVSNPGTVGPGLFLTGASGTPNGVATNIFFGIFNNNDSFLGFLQALKDENVLNQLLAEPKLVTISGKQATFLSGGEQAIPIPATLGQVGVDFREFGTRLSFMPKVLGNGKIELEVDPEVSNLNAANGTSIQGTVVPGRDTQKLHTNVVLEDGQTFAIGGLIQTNVTASITKVPVLGELPFVGAFFSSKSYQDQETELVILVTPRLVDAMACNQLPKYLPGQETRTPDDFELFLEGILEAPRGQREVFQDRHYVPAYKNGPTSSVFPCGDNCGAGRCGSGGCGNSCTTGQGCCGAQTAVARESKVQTAVFQARDVPLEMAGQTQAAPLATGAKVVSPTGETISTIPATEVLVPETSDGKQ